jgi:hypothetical protein
MFKPGDKILRIRKSVADHALGSTRIGKISEVHKVSLKNVYVIGCGDRDLELWHPLADFVAASPLVKVLYQKEIFNSQNPQ